MTLRFKIRPNVFVAIILAFILPFNALAASGAKDRSLGSFGSWSAYAYEEGGQTVCYMVNSKAIKSAGPSKRKPSYLMITHRPTEASTDVVSYGAGTALDSQHGAGVQVGSEEYDLFSARDTAWARDAITDHKIVKAMLSSKQIRLFGVPDRSSSRAVSDVFDLKGFSSAYSMINKACGLPAPKSAKKETKQDDKSKQVAKKNKTAKKDTAKKSSFKKAGAKTTVKKSSSAAEKKKTAKKTEAKKDSLKKNKAKQAVVKKVTVKKSSAKKVVSKTATKKSGSTAKKDGKSK